MKKSIKALFIFPPFWSTRSVSTGIPQIMGFLIEHGYKNIQALDLNIKFHKQFYDEKKLLNLLKEIQINKDKIQKLIIDNENSENLNFLDKHVLKNLEEYLSEEKISKRIEIIKQIDKIRKKEKITVERIKENSRIIVEAEALIQVYEITNNFKLLINFYKSIINDILIEKYDYIGFSINSSIQSFTSLILINMLKLNGYNGHISIGGTNINNLKEKIKNNYDLYGKIIDTAIIGLGEYPTLELFEYISGDRKIENVSNILYFDKNKKFQINKRRNEHIQAKIKPVYNGYSFDEYTLLESVLPIRATYGCYWGKCSFCNYKSISRYESRTVTDVISEIENNILKYKINNFYFVDAGVPPEFLDKFSSEIIKKNIEIYYFANLRFEEKFDKNFLKKLYKSGLRTVGWGLESASERILKLMKKGIDINTSEKILKETHRLGIVNHVYYIYGFPSETIKDFEKTYNFILRNNKFIDSIAEHCFTLLKGSEIEANKEKFFTQSNILKKDILSQINPKTKELEINTKYYEEQINKLEGLIKASNFAQISIDNSLIIGKYRTNAKNP